MDVRGGFSPSCCSATPFQLACDLVLWSCMLLKLYITFLWYVMYLLVFSWINRALGLKRTAPKGCVFSSWEKLRFRGEKKVYCANAPELQKTNHWSALFQKWLCASCYWNSTWREVFAVVHENLLWKNGTSSWWDIQVSSLRLVLKGKQRRFICS